MHAVHTGFEAVAFKSHANTSRSGKQLFKTYSKYINKRAGANKTLANSKRTHVPAHRIWTPKAPHNTWILAPGRPSDKNNVPHAPTQLRLARTHGTHETKTKTKRSRSPGCGGSDKPDELPLTCDCLFIYVYCVLYRV